MGSRGPIPKRAAQRRRVNKDPGGAVTKAPAGSRAAPGRSGAARQEARRGADPEWHELVRGLYLAVRRSGQAAFYEASDYAMLRIGCEVMSQQLSSGKPSAMMFASWDALMARLLVTEGDRRRMRLELESERPSDPDAEAGVASMDAWRDRLSPAG